MAPAGMKRSHLWIPACFALVAGLLVFMAFDRRGAHWLLVWPAANCAAVAAAYFRSGGGVFGKRADGSRSEVVVAWMLPFLTVQYLTWRLQVLVSPENCFDEASPGVFVGRRPLPGEHPAGLDLVVDVTAEFAKPAYHPAGVGYAALPTLDAYVPEPAPYAALLAQAAAARVVLVHCANGHGRSAAFAAALLVKKGLAKDVDEGLALVRKARPACRLNPAQRAAAQSVSA
ncbi:hypothetical protein EPO15_02170 [bacterium]|nr:MAG: hypothetical protein EPO15_02170 [bacterium]